MKRNEFLFAMILIVSFVWIQSSHQQQWRMEEITQQFGLIGKHNTSNHSEPIIQIPLKSIHWNIDATGPVADYEFVQEFVNNEDRILETEYIFPIESGMTVRKCIIENDGKIIKTRIMSKTKADELYETRVKEGHQAYSLSYEHGDILKLRVGNLKSGGAVKIRTFFSSILESRNNGWEVRVPTTYMPRYSSNKDEDFSKLSQQVAGRTVFIPKIRENDKETTYTWTIDVNLQAPTRLSGVKCPSHEIDIKYHEQLNMASVKFKENSEVPNADLIVWYSYDQFDHPRVLLQKNADLDTHAAILTFLPDFDREKLIWEQKGEFIFILDSSGSMGGERMELAKEACEIFIRSLISGCKFNIIQFGSTYEGFFPKSVEYNTENRDLALTKLKTTSANFGGTEMVKPLKFVYEQEPEQELKRAIVLITDGAVWDSNEVIQLIKDNAKHTRVHSLGIGHGVSTELVKGAALAAKGAYDFAVEGEDLSPKVVRLLGNAFQPILSNWRIDWPEGVTPILQTTPPNIFYNEPFVLYAILDKAIAGEITLTAMDSLTYSAKIFTLQLNPDISYTGNYLYKLAVKKYIDAHKDDKTPNHEFLKDLAIKFGVLTKDTAFYGELINVDPATGEKVFVKVPLLMPRDAGMEWNMNGEELYLMDVDTQQTAGVNFVPHKPMAHKERGGFEKNKRNQSQKMYQTIVQTQSVEGQWQMDKDLETLMNIPLETLKSTIPDSLRKLGKTEAEIEEIWATALAVGRLQQETQDQNSWVLIEQKAKTWLKTQGVPNPEELIIQSQKIIISQQQIASP